MTSSLFSLRQETDNPRLVTRLPALGLLLAGMSVSPSLLTKLFGVPSGVIFVVAMLGLMICLLFERRIRFSTLVVAILWLQTTALLIIEIHQGGNSGFIFTVPALLGVLVAYVAMESMLIGVEDFVHSYVVMIIVILVLAAGSVVLAYLGVVHPYPVYDRGTSEQGGSTVYAVGLTLSNALFNSGDAYLVRPSGVFDEPGQFGIMITLALLANAVILRRKSYEILLIVLGMFTISLGYYASVFLYLLLWRTRIWSLVCVSFLFAIVAGLVVESETGGTLIYSQTIGRMTAFFGSEDFGGNRFSGSLAGFDMLWDVGLWGLNGRELSAYEIQDTAATFFGPFLYFGLLGGTILYAHVFLLGAIGILRTRGRIGVLLKNDSFRVFVVMAASLYHRPSCLYFLYYLLILAIYIVGERKYPTQELKQRESSIDPVAGAAIGLHLP